MAEAGHKNNKLLGFILDNNQCPVARMRLFSNGINQNTRILSNEKVAGDKGCLACGNCIDACPVVKEKHRFIFIQNQRTSMSLENVVGDECRRCYKCINSCPQVEKPLKEYVLTFRRGERIIHLLLAASIILLALTGVTSLHYEDILPAKELGYLKYSHRILGVLFLLLPFFYYRLEKRHFFRFLSKIFIWNKGDWVWIKKLALHLKNSKNNPMPPKVEFNPGQKAWYVYVFAMIPIMSVTGFTLLAGSLYPTSSISDLIGLIHIFFALITDIFLFVHIYLKYLRNWAILTFDILKVLTQKKNLDFSLNYNPRNR